MQSALLQSLARDGSTFNRQVLAMRGAAQSGDVYLYGEDYNRSRLVLDPRQKVRDGYSASQIYGPSHPSVEAYIAAL